MAQRFINQRPSAATDPLRNFRFLVKFIPYGDGLKDVGYNPSIGFTSVSGLAMSTDAIPYREGGFATTMHMLPGQQQFSPVVFQRGVVLGGTQSWNWWKKIFDPGYGHTDDTGTLTAEFRCEVLISVLAHPQPLVRDYDPVQDDPVAAKVRLMNAWPTNLAYTDLNAGDSAIWVESMQIVHEGMDVKFAQAPAGQATDANRQWGDLLQPSGA
mgnify:FL=1